MDHGCEGLVRFVASHCDSFELFDFTEEVFDEVTCAICMLVIGDFGNPVFALRDDGFGFLFCQLIAHSFNVESVVGKKSFEVCRFEQWRDTDRIIIFPRYQVKADKIPKRINHCDDFCHATCDTVAYSLAFGPPFAP